ncbi:MAG: hypothetical protein K2W96_17320, partial [Gemmataceae bacterium]|nr:hypothetical protein [Gemmataceae bacterium]
PVPGWLRLWAWLTAALALPLATLGAHVTTTNSGMVDAVGVRSPAYLFQREEDVPGQPVRFFHLLEKSWETGGHREFQMLVEHGHRLLGYLVGGAALVLAIGLGLQARGWHRWLGLLAGSLVAVQGILGILRVSRISLTFAALHACFAQLVFASLVAVAVLCSRSWTKQAVGRPLGRGALLVLLVLYAQLVAGALLRHLFDPIAQRVHLVGAFVAVGAALWLVANVRREDRAAAPRLFAAALAILVLVQPVLGVEALLRRFGTGELPDAVPYSFWADFFRSGHHVVGTLVFSCAAGLAVLLFRPRSQAASSALLHARAMEGAL